MKICLGLIFILYDVRASFSFSFGAAWNLFSFYFFSTFLFFASIFRYGRRICERLCSSRWHLYHNQWGETCARDSNCCPIWTCVSKLISSFVAIGINNRGSVFFTGTGSKWREGKVWYIWLLCCLILKIVHMKCLWKFLLWHVSTI